MREETAIKMTSRLLLLFTLLCVLWPSVEMSSARRHLSGGKKCEHAPDNHMRTKRQVVVVGSEPVHSVEKHVFLASQCQDYARDNNNLDPQFLNHVSCMRPFGQIWTCASLPCLYFIWAEEMLNGSDGSEAFARSLPTPFNLPPDFSGYITAYIHNSLDGSRKRRSLTTLGASHSGMISAQAVNPERDPALRKAINKAIKKARRLKAAGEALRSVPREVVGYQVKSPKVVKTTKVPVATTSAEK